MLNLLLSLCGLIQLVQIFHQPLEGLLLKIEGLWDILTSEPILLRWLGRLPLTVNCSTEPHEGGQWCICWVRVILLLRLLLQGFEPLVRLPHAPCTWLIHLYPLGLPPVAVPQPEDKALLILGILELRDRASQVEILQLAPKVGDFSSQGVIRREFFVQSLLISKNLGYLF